MIRSLFKLRIYAENTLIAILSNFKIRHVIRHVIFEPRLCFVSHWLKCRVGRNCWTLQRVAQTAVSSWWVMYLNRAPLLGAITDDDETRRYRRNWIVIHTTWFLMMTTNTIVLPSQHQFITNSRHPEEPNVSSIPHWSAVGQSAGCSLSQGWSCMHSIINLIY